MTHLEAVDMVVGVMRDPQRIDRYLRRTDEWRYYTTPDRTYLGNDGPYTPPFVTIPVDRDCTDDEAEEIAGDLLAELDHELATPKE